MESPSCLFVIAISQCVAVTVQTHNTQRVIYLFYFWVSFLSKAYVYDPPGSPLLRFFLNHIFLFSPFSQLWFLMTPAHSEREIQLESLELHSITAGRPWAETEIAAPYLLSRIVGTWSKGKESCIKPKSSSAKIRKTLCLAIETIRGDCQRWGLLHNLLW